MGNAPERCIGRRLSDRTHRKRQQRGIDHACQYGQPAGLHVEVATTTNESTEAAIERFFQELQNAVHASRCYRGKILSLEQDDDYAGKARGVITHRLPELGPEDVILPRTTLELVERNVFAFARNAPRLRELGMSVKKGLLFYGPPGTGKTHTIKYLASQLEDHTMLIVTAEQVGCLAEYMQLARLLQPSIVVIEDADLIAREREDMESVLSEVLLNRLLNEMDGLREDHQILFILTTNRPEALEKALIDRPGRVDQAIEFPAPDDEGRRRLVQLYRGNLNLPDTLIEDIVRRTEGTSGAFIKELLRKIALSVLERGDGDEARDSDAETALSDMISNAAPLNRRILGAPTA